MKMSFHGGMCCGIRHIYDMGEPDEVCDALPALSRPNYHDINYSRCDQNVRVYHFDAPKETKVKRLDRYIDFLKEYRRAGVAEIVLCHNPGRCYDQGEWVPILKEKGFIEVTPEGGVHNSNSGNRIRVFHLYTGQD
jgi:hypothetical protein